MPKVTKRNLARMNKKKQNDKKHSDIVEDNFRCLGKTAGYKVRKSSSKRDMLDHIDFFLAKNDERIGVDVKGMRKISGKRQDEYLVIEFLNVQGHPGWLFGKADFIAYEMKDKSFLMVPRVSLLVHCFEKGLINSEDRTDSWGKHLVGKTYRREKYGRKDLVTLVPREGIEDLKGVYRLGP